MENGSREQEFDDLVFSQDNKSAKIKKAIFGIAILAVVVVIIFIVSNSFSSDSSEKSSTGETEEFMDLESDPFFQEMEPSSDMEFSKANPRNDKPEPFDTEIDSSVHLPAPATNENDTALDYLKKEEIFREPEPKADVQEYDVFRNTETPKQESTVETTPQPIVTSIPVQNSNLTVDRKYYIQTGTFFKYKPNEKFLKKIMSLELTYHLDTYISNEKELTRVLIGPFETKSEANEKLSTVKEHIEKSAYILKTRLH